MKKPVKPGQIILLAMTLFVLGSSLTAANYLNNSSDGDNQASFAISIQYENQELDENALPEDADYIEQEGEEEYILVDEHGNIIEENTLLEEQEGEVEEGFAEEGEQYGDQNTEEEGVGYIEGGEYEAQEGEMEEEVYDPDTGGQEVDEPR